MADNPELADVDIHIVPNHPHELNTLIAVLRREFPGKAREEIRDAIVRASQTTGDTDRDAISKQAREILRG